MRYTVVEDYARQQHFDFFSTYRNPFYGLSFQVDITRVKEFTSDRGFPIYLSLCYLVTRAAQQIEDFRLRVHEGRIVRYERLDISATLPTKSGHFGFGFFDYHPDMATFHRHAEEVSKKAREQPRLEEREHFNQVLFTALPTVFFSHFTHAGRSDTTDARPNVAFGRFTPAGDCLVAPVGLEVNHIFIDGEALGDFVEGIQAALDDPDAHA